MSINLCVDTSGDPDASEFIIRFANGVYTRDQLKDIVTGMIPSILSGIEALPGRRPVFLGSSLEPETRAGEAKLVYDLGFDEGDVVRSRTSNCHYLYFNNIRRRLDGYDLLRIEYVCGNRVFVAEIPRDSIDSDSIMVTMSYGHGGRMVPKVDSKWGCYFEEVF